MGVVWRLVFPWQQYDDITEICFPHGKICSFDLHEIYYMKTIDGIQI
jgi:hypothetical protein